MAITQLHLALKKMENPNQICKLQYRLFSFIDYVLKGYNNNLLTLYSIHFDILLLAINSNLEVALNLDE